jgi:uncharacterized membrane protein (UPF0127 family)
MKISINDEIFNVEYLRTQEQFEKGAMGREKIDGCLLFDIGKGEHTFWMKNCLIPLDIVFVNNKIITKIYKNCQPCDNCDEHFKGYGDMILEFESNSEKNFKENDKILFIK